jgi:hypothetical protein
MTDNFKIFMEIIKPYLKDLLKNSSADNNLFKRNLLKEYLQVIVLDFIYSHPKYSRLYFYGGSCLAQCFGLPRLSEDLDFVDLKKEIKLSELAGDLRDYFSNRTDLPVIVTTQKFRIYLKFPILRDLGLSVGTETDQLFLKVEIFSGFDFCKKFETDVVPLFKYNRSILIKTFDLPTLMATKIRAVLYRRWEKSDKEGNIIARVKGRDYFDLMWYLQKGIKPNISCIENSGSLMELKNLLLSAIDKVDARSISLDLEPLIADTNFVKNLSKNMKDILKREVEKMMIK